MRLDLAVHGDHELAFLHADLDLHPICEEALFQQDGIGALALVVGFINPRFLATRNLSDLLLGNAYIAIAAVGMSMVLLTGTLNRVMIVELGVPAWLVGLMVSLPLLFAPFRALIGYKGFPQQGFRIIAAFDVDPKVIGTEIDGVHVYPMDALPEVVGAALVVIAGVLLAQWVNVREARVDPQLGPI